MLRGFSLAGAVVAAFVALSAPRCPAQDARPSAPAFVQNLGQWDAPAAFRIQRGGATAWAVEDGLVVDLRRPVYGARLETTEPRSNPALPPVDRVDAAALRLGFERARPSAPVGEHVRPEHHHFLLGAEAARWRTRVPAFDAVRWSRPWDGIDVLARTHDRGITELLLVVAAGADTAGAVLRWEGAERVEASQDGALRIHTAAGVLTQSAPIAWQVAADGAQRPVPVTIARLDDDGRFCFRLDRRDGELPTFIDPVLAYHGGSMEEMGHGVARDASGRVFTTGLTDSPDFPATPGAYSPTPFAFRDVFVSCFDLTPTSGAVLVWATYLGGQYADLGFDVAVDEGGFVTATGITQSPDFPTVNPVQPAFGGRMDAFVAQLDPTGASLVYSTFVGGRGDDWGCRIVVDARFQTTIGGYTNSPDLPWTTTTNAVQPTLGGLTDAFIVRLAPAGQSVLYSTYHGGSNYDGYLFSGWNGYPNEIRVFGLDVDAAGRIAFCGITWGGYPVTANAFQPAMATSTDAFVTILDPGLPAAAQQVWSSYLGGNASEGGVCARFAPGGELVLAGYTYSSNFPTTSGAFQPTFIGPTSPNLRDDAFVAWFDPALAGAAQLRYGTYLGGGAWDGANGLVVDSRGHATVSGFCSASFPDGIGWPLDAGGHQLAFAGGQDGWIARLRPGARGRQDLTYGTYVGGGQYEMVSDLDPDPDGGVALSATVSSSGIPMASGTQNGTWDAMVGHVEVLPPHFGRGSGSSPHCAAAIVLEVDRAPTTGAPFEMLIGNAPPNAAGVLAFGLPATSCTPIAGALLCVGLPPITSGTLMSDLQGTASVPLMLPGGLSVPIGLGVQAIWLDPRSCGRPGPLASSAMMTF